MSYNMEGDVHDASEKKPDYNLFAVDTSMDLEAQSARSSRSPASTKEPPDDDTLAVNTPPETRSKVIEQIERFLQPHESFWHKLTRVRFFWWWMLGSIFIVIPLALSATVFAATHIDHIRLFGLVLWIEVSWSAFWGSYLLAWVIGRTWFELVQEDKFDADEYEDFFHDLRLSITFMLWSVISWACTFRPLCSPNNGTSPVHWVYIFRRILLATIVVAAIILGKGLVLETIVAKTGASFLRPRKKMLRMRYRALLVLMADAETYSAANSLSDTLFWISYEFLDAHGWKEKCHRLLSTTFIHRRPRDEQANYLAKKWILNLAHSGEGDIADWVTPYACLEFSKGKGRDWIYMLISAQSLVSFGLTAVLESDPDTVESQRKEVIKYETAVKKMIAALCEEKLKITHDSFAERLADHQKLTPPTIDKRETAESLLNMLDTNGNRQIEGREVFDLISEIGDGLREVRQGLNNTKKIVRSFDYVVSALLVIVIAFVYAAFFVENLWTKLTPFWTTFAGLSFAFSGPVSDLANSCEFVFAKQPYDVGDRIKYKTLDLIVTDIALLHTTMQQVDNGYVTHVPNTEASKEIIHNLSRTAELKDVEMIPIDLNITDQHIQELGNDLSEFVLKSGGCDKEGNLEASISRYYRPELALSPSLASDDKKKIQLVLTHVPRLVKASEAVLVKCRAKIMAWLREQLKDKGSRTQVQTGPIVPQVSKPAVSGTAQSSQIEL